ncbi:hypothetical protein RM69_09030 [Mesotoga sp. SC_NapDC3]|nr:hypothetical protein RM69_09030 [Mesotoga sp. SC_NapDC3]PXF33625.1 hypothetical protein EU77_12470 [Mesotoga sp. SC_NapDC]
MSYILSYLNSLEGCSFYRPIFCCNSRAHVQDFLMEYLFSEWGSLSRQTELLHHSTNAIICDGFEKTLLKRLKKRVIKWIE